MDLLNGKTSSGEMRGLALGSSRFIRSRAASDWGLQIRLRTVDKLVRAARHAADNKLGILSCRLAAGPALLSDLDAH